MTAKGVSRSANSIHKLQEHSPVTCAEGRRDRAGDRRTQVSPHIVSHRPRMLVWVQCSELNEELLVTDYGPQTSDGNA